LGNDGGEALEDRREEKRRQFPMNRKELDCMGEKCPTAQEARVEPREIAGPRSGRP
jgi:hypothetical protein